MSVKMLIMYHVTMETIFSFAVGYRVLAIFLFFSLLSTVNLGRYAVFCTT